jgi:hypothetical protein
VPTSGTIIKRKNYPLHYFCGRRDLVVVSIDERWMDKIHPESCVYYLFFPPWVRHLSHAILFVHKPTKTYYTILYITTIQKNCWEDVNSVHYFCEMERSYCACTTYLIFSIYHQDLVRLLKPTQFQRHIEFLQAIFAILFCEMVGCSDRPQLFLIY